MTRKENRKKDEEAKIEVNIAFYIEEFLAWRKLEVSAYSGISGRLIRRYPDTVPATCGQ